MNRQWVPKPRMSRLCRVCGAYLSLHDASIREVTKGPPLTLVSVYVEVLILSAIWQYEVILPGSAEPVHNGRTRQNDKNPEMVIDS